MDRRKFIAIHTYHDDDCKKALWKGVSTWPENDHQWQEDYTFEKCRCTQHWVGDDDFFFCEWEAEKGQDILDALDSAGDGEYIFTAVYEIKSHIDASNLTGRNPWKPLSHLDTPN